MEKTKEKALKTIIKRHNDRQKEEKQKRNNEFLNAVYDVLSDPNNTPDPNDPNYVEEVQKQGEFWNAAMEVAKPQ